MIPLRTTRFIFGATIMVAHFATMLVFAFLGSQKLDTSEVLRGIGTVAPVSAIYLTTFIGYVAANPVLAPDENRKIGFGAFGVQYFIILAFSLSLFGLPLFVFLTASMKFTDASLYTATIDTVFGAYLGIIFKHLFPLDWAGKTP